MNKEQRMYKLKNGSDTAIWAAGEIESLEELLSAYEQKLAETEKALRWVCDVYIVDDYYSDDQRKEQLERAVRRVMVKVTGGEG